MKRKIFLFCICLVAPLIYFSESLAHNISRGYQKLFAVMHYDYSGLSDSDCRKELSWKEKIFCQNAFATDEVMAFLHNVEDQVKSSISHNRKPSVEETFFGNARVVIKSMEFPGFFSNLFRMGMGVNVWNNARMANQMGIPVLKPIAFVEKRSWNKTTTFVAYLFEGNVCVNEIKKSEEWFCKIEDLIDRLNKKCLVHDDLRMKNMVLLENGTIQLIDIDKIHYYPKNSPIFQARMYREIRKFNQNLTENSKTTKHLKLRANCFYGWKSLMHTLMCVYRRMFTTTHYEYVGLDDPLVKKELTWGKKIFCLNEYASIETMKFLRNIEDTTEKKQLWNHQERKGELAVISGKQVIIKSIELDGFFPNLFRMGTGVNIWNNAKFAKLDGIPVLKPIALIEKRTLNKTKTIVVYLYEGEICSKEDLPKIKNLKQLLQQKYVTHHDFYIRNIVKLEDGSLQLIDIDKMHWYPRNSYLFRWKTRQEEDRFIKDLR